MRQGCEIIDLGDGTAIMCGGEPSDHNCNEDATCFDTNDERVMFKNRDEADKWYKDNYKSVRSGSVVCSICKRVAIDNAMWL